MKKKNLFILFLLMILFFPFKTNAKEITLYLFHGDGCPHCKEEIEFLDTIESKYEDVKIVKYEVWYNEENAELLEQVREAFDITRLGVPTTVIGNTTIIGFGGNSGSKIERAIEFYEKEEYVDQVEKIKNQTFIKEEVIEEKEFAKQEQELDEDLTMEVPIVGNVNFKNASLLTSAVIIGLIDGFNPCAMWILLFLISVLIGMKNRKRMWILGLTFLLTSAMVYMFIMLSWITIAVKITTIIWVRNIIAVIALIGGILNLRSYWKSQESGCEVVDDKKRKKIFKKIRQFTSEKSFLLAILGVMGLAISVNLVELACSAGLPLIFTEILAINHTTSMMKIGYTLIYILFFLLDDLVVFFIAMFTMKVTGISTKYNKYSHLLGGIIMLIVGILLILKPEWLMFQFQ